MLDTVKDRIAIKETKARYCRFLDTKDWDGFASVYAEDARQDTSDSGGSQLVGRVAVVEMVRNAVGDARTSHQVHSPEISFIDADNADVIWAMQDRVVWSPEKAEEIGCQSLTGWGHYHERYVRQADGRWLIATQKLTRLHMDMQPFEKKA
ncbi:MAG TPA: nuclear transport factor 2 family protein [Sphingobium sp.]|uniref:nuclear transport factor 2 family protein n=1 Tax=Sphingobium sp. TaxID=1912891 RepID=UPI002ECFD45E